jgi:hypothetical protein
LLLYITTQSNVGADFSSTAAFREHIGGSIALVFASCSRAVIGKIGGKDHRILTSSVVR